jgi:uncharacterized membrane protein HdeD (DUF308 family)
MSSQDVEAAVVFGELQKNWGWLLFLGILFIILGFIGLGRLLALTLASAYFFGILIIIGGIAQFFEAIKCKGWKSVAFHVLIAVLYIIGGIFVLQDPLAASVLLTWVLASVLIFVGILRIVMAIQMRAAGTGYSHCWAVSSP